MSYMIVDPGPEHLRSKYLIPDIARLTADLAAALGGKVVVNNDRDDIGDILLTDPEAGDLTLHVTAQTWSAAKANRIIISARVTGVAHEDNPRTAGYTGDKFRMPSITVSGDRSIFAIAKDVRRRVVEAAAEPATAIREYVRERHAGRDSLASHVANMKASFPEISFADGRGDNYSCPFSLWLEKPSKFYLNGRLNSDGSINIDNMSSVDQKLFATLMAAVKG